MQNNEKKLLVIGEVFTDVHLDHNPIIHRLGGIFHSARALHAVKQKYALAAITPNYLDGYIKKFGQELEANICTIGEIKDVPNVMLIRDSTEAGNQGYQEVLREQQTVAILNGHALKCMLDDYQPTDILIYPGKYNLLELGEALKDSRSRIHIDFQYEDQNLPKFSELVEIQTVMLSTSASIFKKDCNGDPSMLLEYLEGKTKSLLLKENRGGSRYFSFSNPCWVTAPAFLTDTVHSVGVGDCFNALFLTFEDNLNNSMKMASYAASWYASTYDHKIFASNVESLKELKEQIIELPGVRLGWDDRINHHIYIAAPDFPHIDTSWIEEIYNCLDYHNFIPHRPVKENGIICGSEEENIQLVTYYKDIQLLEECSLLVAVLLNDDPGTYVEIGWMARSNKPTILFDPYFKANNLFLKKSVTKVCHSVGEVINAVFECLGSECEVEN